MPQKVVLSRHYPLTNKSRPTRSAFPNPKLWRRRRPHTNFIKFCDNKSNRYFPSFFPNPQVCGKSIAAKRVEVRIVFLYYRMEKCTILNGQTDNDLIFVRLKKVCLFAALLLKRTNRFFPQFTSFVRSDSGGSLETASAAFAPH